LEVVKDPFYSINRETIMNEIPIHIHCNTEEEFNLCVEKVEIFLNQRMPYAPGRVFDLPEYGIGIYRNENADMYSVWCRKW